MIQILSVKMGYRGIMKVCVVLALLVFTLLAKEKSIVNASEPCGEFCMNLNSIKDIKVTPEHEKKFIEKDKAYLNKNIGNKKIESEIKDLEKELSLVKEDYIKTSNDVKVYTGNTALKNNALRTAITNRKDIVNKGKDFKYDDSTKYMMGRDYDKEVRARKTFKQRDLEVSQEAMIEVIENIDMDTNFLEGATFVVSPYVLEGINGYTLSKGNGEQVVVISKSVVMAPESWIIKSIKSTTLHEMGHVFYNSNQIAKMNTNLSSRYTVNSSINQSVPSDNLSKWQDSPTENFAEDFKLFTSNKLGEKSFEPTKKQTNQPYDEASFIKLMDTVAY